MKQNIEELVAGVLHPLTHESKVDGVFKEVGEEEGEEVVEEVEEMLGEEVEEEVGEGEEVVVAVAVEVAVEDLVEVGEIRARQVMVTKPSSPSVGELELPTPP